MTKCNLSALVMLGLLCSASQADVKIVTNDSSPTTIIVDGKVSGLVTDIVQAIQKEVGSSSAIQVLPWARAYDIAKKEPNVVIFTAAKTDERTNLGFTYLGPVFTSKNVLYKKKGSPVSVASLDELKAKKYLVGNLRGDWRTKLLTDYGIEVDEVNEVIVNVKQLSAGRIDLWASSESSAPTHLKSADMSIADVEVAFVLQVVPSYIMFSKGTPPATINQWSKALGKLQKTDVFKKAAKKWSTNLGVSFDYAPNKGFYVKVK